MSPADELVTILRETRYAPPGGEGRPAAPGALALDERGVLARVAAPWPVLARGLSGEHGGLWMAGATGLTWVRGRRVAQLVAEPGYERGLLARAALQEAEIPCTAWTPAGCARQALAWVGARQVPKRGSMNRLRPPKHAYQAWLPGEVPDAGLFDLEAAYYQACCRLPSPVVDWLSTGPIWHPLPGAARERWGRVLGAVRGVKPLRLCLVGCMRGSGRGCVVYHAGERVRTRRTCGPFATAALAVIRAVHELTALEANEDGACWAHTDAVILPGRGVPRVWARYGYRYREEARGAAHIIHASAYRVGNKQTLPYSQGARYSPPPQLPGVPQPLTLTAWH